MIEMNDNQFYWLQKELRRIEGKLDALLEKQKRTNEHLDESTRYYGASQIGSSGEYGEKRHSEK